jgi:tetratricopeptide (TPR) repeat protein
MALAMMGAMGHATDIDALWEYSDPAASEARFRAALETAEGDHRLELLTQVARTHSLRRNFDAAHRQLDQIAPELAGAGPRPRVRALLERGRSFNSAGDRERARALFEDAFGQAQVAQLDGLAVDAAHMVAITHGGTLDAIDWNRRGLALARTSSDGKAQALIPAMLNNSAWDLHDMGRFAEALPWFEEALAVWTARQRPHQIRIARWSLARCQRSLGRYDAALVIQRALADEHAAAGTVDGYVFEELAENLLALRRPLEARAYFERAAEVLGGDAVFVRNEAPRLARLRALAAGSAP